MAKKSILLGCDVRRDPSSGQPKRVRGEFELPPSDTPEGSIRAFLQENAEELQLGVDDDGLACIQDVDTPVGRVCRFRQQQDGIPILGTEIAVRLDRSGKVKQLDLEHVSKPRVAAVETDAEPIKPKDATKLAFDAIGPHKERHKGPKPTQIYFPAPDGLRLAFVVRIATQDPLHDWEVLVDASSGEILKQEDLMILMPDGQGLVFDPNPVVTANDNTLRDPAAGSTCSVAPSPLATVDAQRVARTLRDLTLRDGVYELDGPFVKIRNFGSPNVAPPTEANPNEFNYSSGDARFEAVNTYFHIDTVQRYLQSLGITTAHNRQIEADVHDGSGGAFFSPLDRGLHFGSPGQCRPNRASDGDVALHEYGHAIQADQVPGWGTRNPVTGRRETRAMGEGYGDILACVFFAEHGGGFQREVFEGLDIRRRWRAKAVGQHQSLSAGLGRPRACGRPNLVRGALEHLPSHRR